MKKNKFTFIDLFAGCGGLSEGFLSSGKFEGLAHVEWELPMVNTLRNRLVEKYNHSSEESERRVIHFDIQKTKELLNGKWSEESLNLYQKNNHSEVIEGGVKKIINNTNVDLIIGGPPCQAYSIHGRAKDPNSMHNDYRNFLFESFAFIVQEFQPKMFVFENVPGILSAKPGGIAITKRISEEFNKIGYKILPESKLNNEVFDCSEYNVPQKRKRVLIIGVKEGSNFDVENIYEKIKENRNKSNIPTVRDAIEFLPKLYPLKKAIKKGRRNISHSSSIENKIEHHEARYNNPRDIEIFKEWILNKMNYVSQKEKIDYYYKKTNKKTLYSKYRNLEWDKQSYTIVAHLQKDGLTFIHPDPEQARSITIKEAALLMTFPMDYKFLGSNAYCYKMIGNAVPVNFAKKVSDSIYEILLNNLQE